MRSTPTTPTTPTTPITPTPRRLGRLSRVTLVALAVTAAGFLTGCPAKNEAQKTSDKGPSSVTSATSATAVAASTPAPSSAGSLRAAAATASAAPAAPATDVKNLNDPRFMLLDLGTKLMVEKENRPPSALKADAVFDAVAAKIGKPVGNRGQLAGFPVAAGYCEKGMTDLSVDIVVCEYWDDAALAKGKATALKNETKRREIVTAKSSWISITRFEDTKAAAEQARMIAALVKTL